MVGHQELQYIILFIGKAVSNKKLRKIKSYYW